MKKKEAKKIALKIIKERKINKIDTRNFVQLIEKKQKYKNYKTHCATKSFQALRIFK